MKTNKVKLDNSAQKRTSAQKEDLDYYKSYYNEIQRLIGGGKWGVEVATNESAYSDFRTIRHQVGKGV